MNDLLSLMITQGWGWSILQGSGVTLLLGILGMLLGNLLALPMAVLRWQRVLLLSSFIDGYSLLIRSVPGLLVVYLLFFGSVETVDSIGFFFGFQEALRNAYAMIMGVVSIGLIGCAYSIEVFRGALQAIPQGVIEAAKSLALPRPIIYLKIIGPMMLRNALPGMNNVWQMTLKDTSLVSVVGLGELMRLSSMAAGSTRNPLLFYVIAGLVFLAITAVSQRLFNTAESFLNRGFGGSVR